MARSHSLTSSGKIPDISVAKTALACVPLATAYCDGVPHGESAIRLETSCRTFLSEWRCLLSYEAVCCNVIPLLMGHPPLLATRVVHFPQFLSSSLSLSFTS